MLNRVAAEACLAGDQGGAVPQCLVLLEDCLDNVQLAGTALQSAHAAGAAACGDVCSISQTVADADSRAEEVSVLARCAALCWTNVAELDGHTFLIVAETGQKSHFLTFSRVQPVALKHTNEYLTVKGT